ncbi:hypothetical protein Prudu_019112 [Prunus dulcis]|uniref:Uncharacterized protein n=1 Tax=Prunus dulcis TaxID=3755 RepID=A0A4Y1RTW5_PRUDU|nr:hypothetical protein Prudu_019112 [Prunus dulcis]
MDVIASAVSSPRWPRHRHKRTNLQQVLWSYNSISVTIVNPANDRKWSVVSYVFLHGIRANS